MHSKESPMITSNSQKDLDETLNLLVAAKMKNCLSHESSLFLESAEFLYKSAVAAVVQGAHTGSTGGCYTDATMARERDIAALCALCRSALEKVVQGEPRNAPSPIG